MSSALKFPDFWECVLLKVCSKLFFLSVLLRCSIHLAIFSIFFIPSLNWQRDCLWANITWKKSFFSIYRPILLFRIMNIRLSLTCSTIECSLLTTLTPKIGFLDMMEQNCLRFSGFLRSVYLKLTNNCITEKFVLFCNITMSGKNNP